MRKQVDHERHIGEPIRRWNISKISDARLVRYVGAEVAIQKFHDPDLVFSPDRRGRPTATHQPVHPGISLQPANSVFGVLEEAVALETSPYLPPPIEHFWLGPTGLRIKLCCRSCRTLRIGVSVIVRVDG